MMTRTLAIPAIAALMGTAAGAQTGGSDWSGHRHMMEWGGMGWGGWFMGPLMMLIFLALLVGAVVLIVRLAGDGGGRREARQDRSMEILRERFAKGEIDAEEFEARRKTLEG
jgi:putative membrane protein